MTDSKKILSVVLVACMLLLMAAGYQYNLVLDGDDAELVSLGYSFSHRFALNSVLAVLVGTVGALLIENYLRSEKKLVFSVTAFVGVSAVVFAVRFIEPGMSYLTTLCFSGIALPFAVAVISETVDGKNRYFYPLAVLIPVVTAYFLGGVKTALLFTAVLSLVGICSAGRETRGFALISTAVTLLVLFAAFTAVFPIVPRFHKFLSWPETLEYKALIEAYTGSTALTDSYTMGFLDSINSWYGAPFTHVISVYGWLPGVMVMLIEAVAATVAVILTVRMDRGFTKWLSVFASTALILHLAVSLASSFGAIPLSEVGAPFMTVYGMHYSLAPFTVFVLHLSSDNGRRARGGE